MVDDLDHYPFPTNESFLDFEFESEGPKGRIKKGVGFTNGEWHRMRKTSITKHF